MSSHRAGQDGAVGCGTFNDPQGVSISCSTAGHPGQSPIDTSGGRGKIVGIDDRTGVGGQERVEVFASVGVNPTTNGCECATIDIAVVVPSNVMDMVSGRCTAGTNPGLLSRLNSTVMSHAEISWRTIF